MWVETKGTLKKFQRKENISNQRLGKCSPKEPFLRKPLSLVQKWEAAKTILKTEGKRIGPTQGRHEELSGSMSERVDCVPRKLQDQRGERSNTSPDYHSVLGRESIVSPSMRAKILNLNLEFPAPLLQKNVSVDDLGSMAGHHSSAVPQRVGSCTPKCQEPRWPFLQLSATF